MVWDSCDRQHHLQHVEDQEQSAYGSLRGSRHVGARRHVHRTYQV
jgi:hypothetical protein